MKVSSKIDFSCVDVLTRCMTNPNAYRERIWLELPWRDVANGLFSALRAVVRERECEFIFDDETRQHVVETAQWLSSQSGPTGLLLSGNCGNGKTSVARAIVKLLNFIATTETGPLSTLRSRFLSAGQYCRLYADSERSRDRETDFKQLRDVDLLILDDLGDESSIVSVYGNNCNPVAELLLYRYERRLCTIATTNLLKDQLKDKYGQRLYDRFREMFATVVFENDSFRVN